MTKWRIPEDGIVDELAITLAIDGIRPVRLSPGELELAVRCMTLRGYGIEVIARRLHLSWSEAQSLHAKAYVAAGEPISQAS